MDYKMTDLSCWIMIKVTERNFGGNFKNLTNRQDFLRTSS